LLVELNEIEFIQQRLHSIAAKQTIIIHLIIYITLAKEPHTVQTVFLQYSPQTPQTYGLWNAIFKNSERFFYQVFEFMDSQGFNRILESVGHKNELVVFLLSLANRIL